MTANVGQTRERADGMVGVHETQGLSVREVPLRELNRRTSDVIASVRDGQRTIVTRHGSPVAVILSLPDLLDLTRPPKTTAPVLTPMEATRFVRTALRQLVGGELERRVWRQSLDRYIHGRWWRAADSNR
jgi:prevent-host-death family protein